MLFWLTPQDEVSSRRHYEEEAENYRITNDALQSEVAEQAQSTDNLRGLLYKKVGWSTNISANLLLEGAVLGILPWNRMVNNIFRLNC